jgi:GNAT superfamily N-acetyltransferase
MSQANYEVAVLPVPVAEPHIAKYKEIRLHSLLVDPDAFKSTHARELAFSQDHWRQQLDSNHTATIVAYETQLPAADGNKDATFQGKWVAIMTILGPSAMKDHILANVAETKQVYGIFGMWTHPDHRRRGLGQRLFEAGREWIRRHNDPQNVTGRMVKLMALLAYERNESAVALYRNAGFKVHQCKDAPPDEVPMVLQV